jgi:hypothetical protein
MARAWHPRLTTWVDLVDGRWQRLGLSPQWRRELRVELVTDLSHALVDGAPLEELLAIDPDTFARDIAVAHGWLRATTDTAGPSPDSAKPSKPPPTRVPDREQVSVVRVVVAGILGSSVGGFVALLVELPLISWVQRQPQLDYTTQSLSMLAIYATAALIAALGGGFAVGSACADSPHRRILRRRVTGGLLLSGVVATIVTVGLASSTGYSTRTPVVVSEIALVLGACVVGLVIAAVAADPSRHGGVGHSP